MIFIVFVQVILPTLFVFAIGFLLQRKLNLDIKAISTIALYIFIPCLIFRTFYTADIDAQYGYMILFFILLFVSLILITKAYVWLKKLPQSYESAYLLSTAFMNTGNFGSPIILLAYGVTGFEYAISFFVIQSVSMHCIGLYFAARGHMSFVDALKKVFQLPMIYAVALVAVFKGFSIIMPEPLFVMIDLVGAAAIPTVMIILGMQLAMMKIQDFDWGSITYNSVVRLAVSPLIAYLLTLLFPFDPLMTKVLVLSSAMPSAAVATMLAVQFDARPQLVSSTAFITTLLSIPSITLLLVLLG